MNRDVKYWEVLNDVAASLQQAAHSETAVYETFAAELIKYNLHGTVNWLDDSGENLIVSAVMVSPNLMTIINQISKTLGKNIIGFPFRRSMLPASEEAFATQAPVFLTDNSEYIINTLPTLVGSLIGLIVKGFGSMPAIFTPLF